MLALASGTGFSSRMSILKRGIDCFYVVATGFRMRVDQVEVKDVPDRGQTIHGTDFFPFLVRSTIIRNWHFVGPRFRFANHRSNLNFHAKASAAKF